MTEENFQRQRAKSFRIGRTHQMPCIINGGGDTQNPQWSASNILVFQGWREDH